MGRILVTGASGLLGHALVRDARPAGAVVAVVHRHGVTVPGVRTIATDLTDGRAVRDLLADVRPELVVNCAALTRPEACDADPVAAVALNTILPGELARGCVEVGARLVQISTDAVYGHAAAPYREDTAPEPVSGYARTKLAGERAAVETLPSALVLRVNFFGWSAGGDRSLAEFFLSALRADRSVTGFTDVEFSPMYHRDLVDVVLRAVSSGIEGVWNAGGSEALSKYAFGQRVARTFGLDADLVRPGSRHDAGLTAARTDRLTMDSRRLTAALGTLPGASSGLRRMHADERDGYVDELTAQLASTSTG